MIVHADILGEATSSRLAFSTSTPTNVIPTRLLVVVALDQQMLLSLANCSGSPSQMTALASFARLHSPNLFAPWGALVAMCISSPPASLPAGRNHVHTPTALALQRLSWLDLLPTGGGAKHGCKYLGHACHNPHPQQVRHEIIKTRHCAGKWYQSMATFSPTRP